MNAALEKSGEPPCYREDAAAVVARLRAAGHVAYFAGGCVRDELMGLEPKDFDVATDARPERVRSLFRNTQAVGAAFGVILVRQSPSEIQVATFRTDERYLDGRHPESVHFTDAEHDAKRRDFTINGLFLDPADNKVIDYVGGRDDITARRLRAIGKPEERFSEDHLRLLRAVRFAARLGFEIERETADAIRKHAPMLARISPERIADELRLTLTAPRSRREAWAMLWEYGLIDVIFRHLPTETTAALSRERSVLVAHTPDEPLAFGQVLAAALLCYRWQRSGGRDIRLFLGHEAARIAGRAMRQALRISNEEVAELEETTEMLAPMLADQAPTLAMKKRFLGNMYYPSAMELMEAISQVGECTERIGALYGDLSLLQTTEYAPPPFVTGDDLTAAAMKPGPIFKKILSDVYDAQLEGRIQTKQEAMEMAVRIWSPSSG